MNFLRKYWFIILLAVIATVLLFFWIQGNTQKKKKTALPDLPKISYPEFGGQAILARAVVNIKTDVPSKELKVYQIVPLTLNLLQASNVAGLLGFPQNPSSVSSDATFGQVYLWLGENQNLAVRSSPVDIGVVTDSLFLLPVDGVLPSEDAGVGFLRGLVGKFGFLPTGVGFSQSSSKVLYEGDVIQVGLVPTVEGVGVVDNNPENPLVYGGLRRDGTLHYLSYRVGFSNPQKGTAYPLKTKAEIQESLTREGRVMLIGEAREVPRVLTPQTLTITSINPSLFYFAQVPTVLYPIYALSGTAFTQEGEVPVFIYLPAVKSKYFQSSQVESF